MKLTEEQLEQCRREFGAIFLNASDKDSKWIGFQAAWRPVPTVEEIENILDEIDKNWVDLAIDSGESTNTTIAQAIHRAFGGNDE